MEEESRKRRNLQGKKEGSEQRIGQAEWTEEIKADLRKGSKGGWSKKGKEREKGGRKEGWHKKGKEGRVE